MRTTTALFAAGLAISGPALAQSNEEKYHEKLAKEFVSTIAWERDLGVALAKAEASGKLVFGYFSRSYSP